MSAFTFAAAQLMRVIPRRRVSRVMGRLADHAWSPPVGRAVVKVYSRLYDVDFEECAKREDFKSFDEFFTRPLKDGARPLPADPKIIVSPADGRLESMGAVDVGSTWRVKGRNYRVEELVGDPVDAKRYIGGGGFVVYLSPRDYHRVHAPVAGKVSLVRSMPGDYFPVNAIGLRHIDNLFAINRRVAICIDTEELGRVTVVMVAAIVVGRITVSGIDAHDVPLGVHHLSPELELERGAEIGQFHLGSTAVVFLEPKAFERWLGTEGPVRVGADIAAPKGGG